MAVVTLLIALIVTFDVGHSSQWEPFEVQLSGHKFKLIDVTKNKFNLCSQTPVMAKDSNRDLFITSDLRFNLCKASYELTGRTFESDFSRSCFADEGHIASRLNPCFLICQEKSKLSNERNSDDCDSSDQMESRFVLTNFSCGHDHVCDSNGCCVLSQHETSHKTNDTSTVTTPETHDTLKPVTNAPENLETPDYVTPDSEPVTPITSDPITPTLNPVTPDSEPVTPITSDPITPTLDPVTPDSEPVTPITSDPITPTLDPLTPDSEPVTPITSDPITPTLDAVTPDAQPNTTDITTPDLLTPIPDSVTPSNSETLVSVTTTSVLVTSENNQTSESVTATNSETLENSVTQTTKLVTLETSTPITSSPTTTIEPKSAKPHCETSGYFRDKHSSHIYYFCKFFATIHSCAPDEKFDIVYGKCLFDQSIDDPALEFAKWSHSIRCTKEGTFISPYNCKYFYNCVPNGIGFNVYFNYCFNGLVFDETSQQCTYKTHRCHNQLHLVDIIDGQQV